MDRLGLESPAAESGMSGSLLLSVARCIRVLSALRFGFGRYFGVSGCRVLQPDNSPYSKAVWRLLSGYRQTRKALTAGQKSCQLTGLFADG
jgi:hypothetical protein